MDDIASFPSPPADRIIRYLSPHFHNMPAALISRPQWILWRFARRGEALTKIPLQPDGSRASVTDADTWAPFDFCRTAYETSIHPYVEPVPKGHCPRFNGVGFVVGIGDPFTVFDFDHCRDLVTKEIDPKIASYIAALDSYTELSPSATGIRVVVAAKLPPRHRRIGSIEMYDAARFVTITGRTL